MNKAALGGVILMTLILASCTNQIESINLTFGTTGYDSAYDIKKTMDGGFIVAGNKAKEAYVMEGWIFKFDSMGQYIWDQTISVRRITEINSIHETKDGNFIVAGRAAVTGFGDYHPLIAKLDQNARVLWHKTICKCGGYSTKVLEADDGGYIILSNKSRGFTSSDMWLSKFKPDGKRIWNKIFKNRTGRKRQLKHI